nr:hypothetical protein Iba_chr06bCG0660 [Ipomoea batatas]
MHFHLSSVKSRANFANFTIAPSFNSDITHLHHGLPELHAKRQPKQPSDSQKTLHERFGRAVGPEFLVGFKNPVALLLAASAAEETLPSLRPVGTAQHNRITSSKSQDISTRHNPRTRSLELLLSVVNHLVPSQPLVKDGRFLGAGPINEDRAVAALNETIMKMHSQQPRGHLRVRLKMRLHRRFHNQLRGRARRRIKPNLRALS